MDPDKVTFPVLKSSSSPEGPGMVVVEISCNMTVLVNASIVFKVKSVGCNWNDTVSLHRLKCPFAENNATWECSDFDTTGCCNQWRMTDLPPKVHTSFWEQPSATHTLSQGGDYEITFDVTADLENFLQNGGFPDTLAYILKKDCEEGEGCALFYSCEGGFCPYLKIELLTPCPTNPPIVIPPPCPDHTCW